jgi:hypothetical protein
MTLAGLMMAVALRVGDCWSQHLGAVQTIEDLGGRITYGHETKNTLGEFNHPWAGRIADSTGIRPLSPVFRVNLLERESSDEDLAFLTRLLDIRELRVRGDITDQGLAPLLKCPRLSVVELDTARVSFEFVQQLCRKPGLLRIRVSLASLTEEQLAFLRRENPWPKIEGIPVPERLAT